MSDHSVPVIPTVGEITEPPTLGKPETFDQDADAYLYSQHQAFVGLNNAINVLNPVAATVMQKAEAIETKVSEVQQLATQAAQNVSQVNQQADTVGQKHQQVNQLADVIESDRQRAENAANTAVQTVGMNSNNYYDKESVDAIIKGSASAFSIFGGL